jgi:glycosyltransferase involved in cell wall biosynthesis
LVTAVVRHWAINGRFLTQPMTGVQRYGREILTALDALAVSRHLLARGVEFEVLVPPGEYEHHRLKAIPVRVIGQGRGHLWEQAYLAPNVRGGLISLCNTGPLLVRKHIVCIHDLNTRLAPSSYSRQFRMLYRVLVPMLGQSAAAMTTVSQFSAGQLTSLGIRRPGTVDVAPNGHEHALRWHPQQARSAGLGVDRDTVLLIGSRAPHKNMDLLLRMSGKLRAAGLRLAIVGAQNARIFQSHAGAGEAANVVWLGRVDDDELAGLLTSCLCLAFPSFTEGFGLPPLEAMTLGCPVVVSDRASLPEVCGDGALYASPDSEEEWLAHFRSLRDHPNLRRDLIARGRAAAARYSWTRSAFAYLEIMARLDGFETGVSSLNAPVQTRENWQQSSTVP